MEVLQHSAGVDEADKAEAKVISSTTTEEVVTETLVEDVEGGCGISHTLPSHPVAQDCNVPSTKICNMPQTQFVI